jgi:hypothetical protein
VGLVQQGLVAVCRQDLEEDFLQGPAEVFQLDQEVVYQQDLAVACPQVLEVGCPIHLTIGEEFLISKALSWHSPKSIDK